MKYTKIISLVVGGLGAGWFFLPTIKMLKWVLPILLFIWITTSVIGCYSKANPIIHEKTIEKIVYKTVDVPKEIVRYVEVNLTNAVTQISYVDITNSVTNVVVLSHTIDCTAISPVINDQEQRLVYLDGEFILCTVKRSNNKLIFTSNVGVYTIPILGSRVSESTLASLPYTTTPETYAVNQPRTHIVEEPIVSVPIKKVYVASNRNSMKTFAKPRICSQINYR
jgi:hypothetical protein